MSTIPRKPLYEIYDLTDPARNVLFNVSLDDARSRVAAGDVNAVRAIEGHFALVARDGPTVRLARSLSLPLRYFLAKQADGPALVVADRIDAIRGWLDQRGLGGQFYPTYTRMAPAHHLTEIELVGCPDPNPVYRRFFSPTADRWPADVSAIGRRYVAALQAAIVAWLQRLPPDEPIGVCFSGGADSGAVFLTTYHTILALGLNPARLKAFTLSVDGRGADADQASAFLRAVGLQLFHEVVEVDGNALDYREAVAVLEDYKPLDVQAGAMTLALCRGIRRRYSAWRFLIDGDGGDENLKDYPIEENPELTIRSVLGNRLLYQEGWGIGAIKHSLTYGGGLSRACTRTYGPMQAEGFIGFSPLALPSVVEVAEGIPFAVLTNWQHGRLYSLKGEVLSRGVEALTGLRMPVFKKRRFQHGAAEREWFHERFPADESAYRRAFAAIHDA